MTTQQRQTLEAGMRAHPLVDGTITERRAAFEALFADRTMPIGTTARDDVLGGRPVAVAEPADAERGLAVLYLHGGGYVVGSGGTGRVLASLLADRTGATAFSLDYRLAPEHPHPAALDDALAAYRDLLERGFTPSGIAIAGDSAGGGLAIALLAALREAGLPRPAAAVVFSPFTDLAVTGDSVRKRAAADPLLTPAALHGFADAYLAGADPTTPSASPHYADLTGLPPLLIQLGTHEVLLDDAIRLAEHAADAGVEVTLDVVAGMPHVFQSNAGVLTEADDALDRAGAFIRASVAAPVPLLVRAG